MNYVLILQSIYIEINKLVIHMLDYHNMYLYIKANENNEKNNLIHIVMLHSEMHIKITSLIKRSANNIFTRYITEFEFTNRNDARIEFKNQFATYKQEIYNECIVLIQQQSKTLRNFSIEYIPTVSMRLLSKISTNICRIQKTTIASVLLQYINAFIDINHYDLMIDI